MAITLILKYFKLKNVNELCLILKYVTIPVDIFKDLLKLKGSVIFVFDDATPKALTTYIIKKFTKNDKILHQVIKLAKQSNCYQLNVPLTFLEYIENRNKFLKIDSELAVYDDLVLKSNRIVIPSDLQNHVIPLAY